LEGAFHHYPIVLLEHAFPIDEVISPGAFVTAPILEEHRPHPLPFIPLKVPLVDIAIRVHQPPSPMLHSILELPVIEGGCLEPGLHFFFYLLLKVLKANGVLTFRSHGHVQLGRVDGCVEVCSSIQLIFLLLPVVKSLALCKLIVGIELHISTLAKGETRLQVVPQKLRFLLFRLSNLISIGVLEVRKIADVASFRPSHSSMETFSVTLEGLPLLIEEVNLLGARNLLRGGQQRLLLDLRDLVIGRDCSPGLLHILPVRLWRGTICGIGRVVPVNPINIVLVLVECELDAFIPPIEHGDLIADTSGAGLVDVWLVLQFLELQITLPPRLVLPDGVEALKLMLFIGGAFHLEALTDDAGSRLLVVRDCCGPRGPIQVAAFLVGMLLVGCGVQGRCAQHVGVVTLRPDLTHQAHNVPRILLCLFVELLTDFAMIVAECLVLWVTGDHFLSKLERHTLLPRVKLEK